MIERLARPGRGRLRQRIPLSRSDDRSRRISTMLITQSGETADTIAAMRESSAKGSKTLGICNVVGSMIAREANGTDLHACRPGDRRRLHQGLHRATHRAVPVRCVSRAKSAAPSRPTKPRSCSTELTLIPGKLEALARRRRRDRRTGQAAITARRTSSSSDAASIIRSRWKARSS